MKKSYLLGIALSSLLAAPAMAGEDFRALSEVSGLTPMAEEQLATIEGGAACSSFNFLSIQAGAPQTCLNLGVITQTNAALVAGLQANVSYLNQEID